MIATFDRPLLYPDITGRVAALCLPLSRCESGEVGFALAMDRHGIPGKTHTR